MTIQNFDKLISEIKTESGVESIYITLNYSEFGNYIDFNLKHGQNDFVYTMASKEFFNADNDSTLELLKNLLLNYAKKLIQNTNSNLNKVGWAQCNQCSWGTEVYKYGDNYISGNSCPCCLVGIYNISFD